MKKLFSIITVLLLSAGMLSGCAAQASAVVPNQALLDTMNQTNNQLLEQNTLIHGELLVNVTGTGEFQGSKVSLSFNSDSKANTVAYSGSLSSQTVIYLVNQIFNTDVNGLGVNFDLASFSDSFVIGDSGNFSGNYLKFDSKALDPFFKTNKLYFSDQANMLTFGTDLTSHIVSSTTNIDRSTATPTTQTVTTLQFTGNDIASLIPFTNFSFDSLDHNVEIVLVQNEGESTFSRIDIQLFQYQITAADGIIQASADIKLSFDLTGEGV